MATLPFPALDEILHGIGEAGARLAQIEASEGAAGNISVLAGWNIAPPDGFGDRWELPAPLLVPELAGASLLVTGSGRRLREVGRDPGCSLVFLTIGADGASMTAHAAPQRLFERPTSELNTHLAIHARHGIDRSQGFHTVVHAQPLYLTYLSHIPRYEDSAFLNRHILRWQPETIIQPPQGVAALPFLIPGSTALMQATVQSMDGHRLVLWGKHGVVSRANASVKKAVDLIEYAETGARYEYLNLTNHGLADGLSADEIRDLCRAFGVEQTIF